MNLGILVDEPMFAISNESELRSHKSNLLKSNTLVFSQSKDVERREEKHQDQQHQPQQVEEETIALQAKDGKIYDERTQVDADEAQIKRGISILSDGK